MWFAARDVAFESPTAEIDIDAMLARMGFGQPGRPRRLDLARAAPRRHRRRPRADRQAHDPRAASSRSPAFHTFAWAEDWLADPDLVAGDGEAAASCRYIRADETPHVGYLKTALTEMRDRTWIGSGGTKHTGTDMIGTLWDARPRPVARRRPAADAARPILGEVEHWCLPARPTAPTSSPSSTRSPTRRRGSGVKFGIFYEHQLPRPWDEDSELQLIQDALEQVELADQLGFDVVWEVEHHFLEEYSHSLAPPRCSSPPPASAPRTSASATGSSRPRPATTTRPAPPSGSPCSTSCRTAGSSSARASRRRRPSWAASASTRCYKREAVARGPRGRHPLHDRGAVHRRRRASSSRCRPATSCPSRCRSRTRRCGWPAPAATRSCSPPRRASARSPSPSSTPRRPRHWVGDYEPTPGREVRPRRPGRQRQRRLRDPDDVRPDRGATPSPRASRAATSSATRSATTTCSATTCRARPTCGQEFLERRAEHGLLPRVRGRPRRGAPRRQGRRRRHHRPARRHRHARPDPRVPRCATRRPASTSSSS